MIYFNAGRLFSLLGSIAYLDIFSFNSQLNILQYKVYKQWREFNAFCKISIFAACLMMLCSDIFSS